MLRYTVYMNMYMRMLRYTVYMNMGKYAYVKIYSVYEYA